MGVFVLLIVGLPVVGLIVIVAMYNGLVRIRNHCKEAWADVDTELQRRYNVIPNLVSTVKGYAAHEAELLNRVTQLREECVHNNGSPKVQSESEQRFQGALHGLMVRLENYPDLKASANFLSLQEELANTENRIQAARRFYNGNVRDNNNRVQTFPSNVIASMFGFSMQEFFKIEDDILRAAPKASF
jgi:LemA protein